MSWSVGQYTAFEDERTRPVRDLVAAIPRREARTAVDLGCGPGNSTQVLAARFPDAHILGVDNSPDMIAAARQRLPAIGFQLAAIETWDDPGPYEVILANASLQWVPDHAALFPRLAGRLAPGGSLAVQMPDNLDEPAHVLMRQVAAEGPWADRLAGASRTARWGAEWYFTRLRPHCAQIDVWRTTYHHLLAGGAASVVEWFKGTSLRPFLSPLDTAEQTEFLARYTAAVAKAYLPPADGSVLLPFPRLFIVATR